MKIEVKNGEGRGGEGRKLSGVRCRGTDGLLARGAPKAMLRLDLALRQIRSLLPRWLEKVRSSRNQGKADVFRLGVRSEEYVSGL